LFETHNLQVALPPSLLLNGCRNSFSGVKLSGREFDDTFPSKAEVKNEWSNISLVLHTPSWHGQGKFYLHLHI